MRNDNEHALSPETVEVDHARRRLLVRLAIAFAILFITGVIVFNGVTDALSTPEGKEGFVWALIMTGCVSGFLFIAYVLAAYTPIFKVMPKGQILRPRNWGKKKLKNVA